MILEREYEVDKGGYHHDIYCCEGERHGRGKVV